MTIAEAESYYETLSSKQKRIFSLLSQVGLELDKSVEEAYEYAKEMIDSNGS
jgi:hypothetical protein